MGSHMIMRKYGGYRLEHVMDLYVTEFYGLIKMLGYEIHQENEANKKARLKQKRR